MVVTEIRNIPYFDGHCDTIYECMGKGRSLRENSGHVDLMRGERYGRRAQFFALFDNVRELPEGTAWTKLCQMHDWFCAQAAENADVMALCRTGAEVDAAAAQHKTAALLSIEGADLLDCDMAHLETAASWGVRLLNPVWNRANSLCGTNCEEPDRGLSQKGKLFVRRMEEMHIYPDMSHISDAGFWDVIKTTHGPVVASHSDARAICPNRRILTDDQFRAIRDSGGVVGLNLYRDFAGPQGTIEELAAHVEHFLNLGGEKTLCIGGDLDGCEALAAGMQGVQDVPKLYAALQARGYSEALLEDIFWNNLRSIL